MREENESNVAAIYMDDRLMRSLPADKGQIGFQGLLGNTFLQMSGEAFYGIDFMGLFMELVYNIRQQAASGGEHAVERIPVFMGIKLRKLEESFY